MSNRVVNFAQPTWLVLGPRWGQKISQDQKASIKKVHKVKKPIKALQVKAIPCTPFLNMKIYYFLLNILLSFVLTIDSGPSISIISLSWLVSTSVTSSSPQPSTWIGPSLPLTQAGCLSLRQPLTMSSARPVLVVSMSWLVSALGMS